MLRTFGRLPSLSFATSRPPRSLAEADEGGLAWLSVWPSMFQLAGRRQPELVQHRREDVHDQRLLDVLAQARPRAEQERGQLELGLAEVADRRGLAQRALPVVGDHQDRPALERVGRARADRAAAACRCGRRWSRSRSRRSGWQSRPGGRSRRRGRGRRSRRPDRRGAGSSSPRRSPPRRPGSSSRSSPPARGRRSCVSIAVPKIGPPFSGKADVVPVAREERAEPAAAVLDPGEEVQVAVLGRLAGVHVQLAAVDAVLVLPDAARDR